MTHSHFCDVAGHYWDCDGTATRPLAGSKNPSTCMCPIHDVPMTTGDHSLCPIELLACPEHPDDQVHSLPCGEQICNDYINSAGGRGAERNDAEAKPIIGFCLWCNLDFYSMEDMTAHHARGSESCEAIQQYQQNSNSPILLSRNIGIC